MNMSLKVNFVCCLFVVNIILAQAVDDSIERRQRRNVFKPKALRENEDKPTNDGETQADLPLSFGLDLARLPQNSVANTNGWVKLECAVDPHYTGAYRIIWSDFLTPFERLISDNTTIYEHPNQARYSIVHEDEHEYSLRISSVLMIDAGVYKCENSLASAGTKKRHSLSLTVLSATMSCSTSIFNSVQVQLNSPHSSECRIDYRGELYPNITWVGPEPYVQIKSLYTPALSPGTVHSVAKCNVTKEMNDTNFHAQLRFFDYHLPAGEDRAENIPTYTMDYDTPVIGVAWRPTSMSITPERSEYISGDVLTCYADAHPKASYSWKNSRTSETFSGVELTLPVTWVGTNQWIVCTATNMFGGLIYKTEVSINVNLPGSPPDSTTSAASTTTTAFVNYGLDLARLPQNSVTNTNSWVKLECAVDPHYTGAYRIIWSDFLTPFERLISENTSIYEHPNQARYSIVHEDEHEYSLRVSSVLMIDAGVYKCENVLASAGTKKKHSLSLTVLSPTMSCSTSIFNKVQVQLNTPHSSECRIDYRGELYPNITWVGPEPFVQVKSLYTPALSPGTVHAVAKCNVTKDMNDTNFHAQLRFFDYHLPAGEDRAENIPTYTMDYDTPVIGVAWRPTSMSITPERSEYISGDVLTCYADAHPKASYSWKNSRTSETFSGVELTLPVTWVGTNQWIICTATNMFGGLIYKTEVSINVNLPGSPPDSTTIAPTTTTTALVNYGLDLARLPQNSVANPNSWVKLECAVDPHYTGAHRIIWSDFLTPFERLISENTTIYEHPNQARYSIVHEDEHEYSLHISSVLMIDAGVYKCENVLASAGTKKRHSLSLTVLSTSMSCSTSIFSSVQVQPNTPHSSECRIEYRGELYPNITWEGPEPFVQVKSLYIPALSSGTVHAVAKCNVTKEMDGENFRALLHFTDHSRTVDEDRADNIPFFTMNYATPLIGVAWRPTNMSITPEKSEYSAGDVLTCYADAHPKASYSWRNSRTLETFSGVELKLPATWVGTNQWIICTAANMFAGARWTTEESINVNLPGIPESTTSAPSTTTLVNYGLDPERLPQNTAGSVNSWVVFECAAAPRHTGNHQIIWSEVLNNYWNMISSNENLVSHANRARYSIIHRDEYEYSLRIGPVKLEDGGYYKCYESSYNVVKREHQASLTVLGENLECTTQPPLNGVVLHGMSFLSKCEITYRGAFIPNMTWDGPQPFSQTYNHTSATKKVSSLLQFNVTKDNAMLPEIRYVATADFSGNLPPISTNYASNIPAFMMKYFTPLMTIYWGPMNAKITPEKSEYRVHDQLSCSADALPQAVYSFQNLRTLEIFHGSVFEVPEHWAETNQTVRCSAQNMISGVTYTSNVFINVFVLGSAATTTDSTTTTKRAETTTHQVITSAKPPTSSTISSPHLAVSFNGTMHVTGVQADGTVLNVADLTLACMSGYASEFRKSFVEAVGRLNSNVKTGHVCPETSNLIFENGDIVMLGRENQIVTEFSTRLSTGKTYPMQSVESCAQTGDIFIQDFSNWRQPIIGSVNNCPSVEFNPSHFDSSGAQYVCAESEQ